MVEVRLGEVALRSIDWSTVQTLVGPSSELGGSLAAFIGGEDENRMLEFWWGLEGIVFSQGRISEAAVPVVDVLMAALVDDRPLFVKAWILEALRFIVSGGCPDDPDLAARCLGRARAGAWLLAAVSPTLSVAERDAVVELLMVIDLAVAEFVTEANSLGQ